MRTSATTRDAAFIAFAVLLATGVGIATAAAVRPGGALNGETAGIILLSLFSAGSLVAFGPARRRLDVGAAALLAVASLATAFVLGLTSGDYRVIANKGLVASYFALGLGCLTIGILAAAALAPRTGSRWPIPRNPPLQGALGLFAAAVIVLAVANMVLGEIPLLAQNVDEARFNSQPGPLASIFVLLIGGLQAIVLIVALTKILKPGPMTQRLLLTGALLALALIASRSILAVVGLSFVIALVTLGRLGLGRLVALAMVGVLALGFAGSARVKASDPTGIRQAFLETHGYNGVTGIIAQSSTSSPWVFGEVLTAIPARVDHQHGTYFFRDFRAQFPGHPFGEPLGPDTWITADILYRNPTLIGGSPPTLVGGLYIDWGVPGIIVGCLLIGAGLVALFNWARRAGTVGALALYSYAGAYIVLSAYNYVSAKPITIAALGFCFLAHRAEMNRRS